MSTEAFFDDPYNLSPEDLVSPSDFDERLRPLLLLYEIGQGSAELGVLPHHVAIGPNAIGVLLDDDGRVIRMATASELPLVGPTSTRSRQVLPHLGADDLGKLLSSSYRQAWLDELQALGDQSATSLSAFIGALPIYDKLDNAAKKLKQKPDPEAARVVVERLAQLGLVVDTKVFSTEQFPKVVSLDATGDAMCELETWRDRHIAKQSADLASKVEGRCSITGRMGPLARLTPSVQGLTALMGGTGRSAVVSVNQETFEGLYRDGLRDAAISVHAAELMAVGLSSMLADSSVAMKVGSRTALKRKTAFDQGKGKKKKSTAVSILMISESFGSNAAENLLMAFERTIRAPWIPQVKADDGSVVNGYYEHPEVDRIQLLSDASVLVAVFGGSSAGISFDSWHELGGIEAGQRIIAWSRSQLMVPGQSFGFDVQGLASSYAVGAGNAFLRSLTHGEAIPAWVARAALDELFKPDGFDRSTQSNKYLATLGLFLFGTNLNEQEHNMSSLRDTPAFRLGAWLGAIQTAWEKGVGDGKQERGPVSGIRSLASKPGDRWAQLTFRYEESIGPSAPRWADIAQSKAAAAFLELDQPFPETLTTNEQAIFVLGYQSRWDKKQDDKNTEDTESNNNNEATKS